MTALPALAVPPTKSVAKDTGVQGVQPIEWDTTADVENLHIAEPYFLQRAIRTELGRGVRHRTSRYLITGWNKTTGASKADTGRCAASSALDQPARFCRGYDELRNFLLPARARRSSPIAVPPPHHDRAGHPGSRVTERRRQFRKPCSTQRREI